MAIRDVVSDSGKISVSSILALTISFVLVLQLPLFSFEASEERTGEPVGARTYAYTPHLPILIEDDSDFDLQGWPGKGTWNDPYVIEGLDIDGLGYQLPVCIRGTTAYFILRGCHLYNGVDAGVLLDGVHNGVVSDNLCTVNSPWGIWVSLSEEISVINNTCTGNFWTTDVGAGIYLDRTIGGHMMNNSCGSNWGDGIRSSSSTDAMISGNNCSGNYASGILTSGGSFNLSENLCFDNVDPDIDLSNVPADGSSVVYGNRFSDMEAIGMFGCTVSRNTCDRMSMISCDDNSVDNNTCSPSGIRLAGSKIFSGCQNNLVADNDCSGSWNGIWIYLLSWDGSEDNISGANRYLRNDLRNCQSAGIYAIASDGNLFEGNNYSYSATGLSLEKSDKNLIRGEMSVGNAGHAIQFANSTYNTLRNCAMWFTGIGIVSGSSVQWATHDIDSSNTVNGLPVYYAKGLISGSVPSGIGQVILASSKNVVIDDVNILNASTGIAIGHCSYVTVTNSSSIGNVLHGMSIYSSPNCTLVDNELSWNGRSGLYASTSDGLMVVNNTCEHNLDHGIMLQWCDEGTYQQNNCSFNSEDGLHLSESQYNRITGNVFEGNLNYGVYVYSYPPFTGGNTVCGNVFLWNNGGGKQAYCSGSQDVWNSSAGGNWWSDWQSPDDNSDGIVDLPYVLDGGYGIKDYLPLTGLTEIPEPQPVVLVSILMVVLAIVGVANRRRTRSR